MRIAVAGTHASGKSTLIEEFLAAHPECAHEPEPCEWLEEVYGEPLPEEPGADDFHRQLEISVARLSEYPPASNVIAERSPLDFVAYLHALIDLGRERRDAARVEEALALARRGMRHVDLLVVLPLTDVSGAEDPELREAMHARLLELVETEAIAGVVEVHGTTGVRLAMLEAAT